MRVSARWLFFLLAPLACSPREDDARLRQDWGECVRNTDCASGRICRSRKCVVLPPSPTGAALVPPEGMVHVPAGEFLMGANRGIPLERPQVNSRTQDFFIDIREVTLEAWLVCQQGGHCPAPLCDQGPTTPGRPVTCVTRQGAAAYCAFVQKRLPTEEEWEKAARGTDARTFPWGEESPTCERAVHEGCTRRDGPEPSGQRPSGAGPFGTLDQAGNVWEWTGSSRPAWNKERDPRQLGASHAPPPGLELPPSKPGDKPHYIVRGGSYLDPPLSLRTSNRLLLVEDFHSRALGFRCAADPR